MVNLHYILSKASVKARPNVLWCYKKDLYLSSHRRKRMKQARPTRLASWRAAACRRPPSLARREQVKKMVARGLLDPEKEDPFSLFVASTNIRYCFYSETHNILGNTFGMVVLQDFEALTPNLLARTIETVEGGGIVVLLVSTLASLSKLYTMSMDVHARFRTESHQEARAARAAPPRRRQRPSRHCPGPRWSAASTSASSSPWRTTRRASSWTTS